MSGIDRGLQRPGEREGTPTGLYLQQPPVASSMKQHWPGGTPAPVAAPSREKTWQQQQQDLKHREYLKQQQRLKAMGVPNNKNVSADALIGNLLEKKDTFRPKQPLPSQVLSPAPVAPLSPVNPAVPVAPVPVHGMPAPSPVAVARSDQRVVNEDLPPWIWPGSARLPPIYTHIWTLVVDPASGGKLVDTNRIFPLLLTSGLPTQVLGFTWNLAAQGVPSHVEQVPGGTGQLSQQQLYVLLALVALAQTGCTFNSLSILKMLPQPPIPMFNMGTKSPSSEGTHVQASASPIPTPPVASPYTVPVAPVPVAIPPVPVAITPVPEPISLQQTNASQDNSFFSSDSKEDDFTEFQSADVPTATVVQPSSAAKQVVNELNHSVIARFGNQGRSIGSRLANHTLGAPKPTRSHHHKHHRSERRASTDMPYFDDEVTFGGGRARKLSNDNSHAAKAEEAYIQHQQGGDSSENDDFSDFQVAIGLNVNVDELFPKCKQLKKRTMVLKESAIRSEPDENAQQQQVDMLSLDAPVLDSALNPALDLLQCTEPARIEPPKVPPPIQPPPQRTIPQAVANPIVIQPPPAVTPKDIPCPIQPPGGKELMTEQEDKYSALRFLELEPEAVPTNASDDFGDFVSAGDSFTEVAPTSGSLSLFSNTDPKVTAEDSFLEIAERDVETGKSVFVDSEPKKVETRIEEFAVDDWLSFESNSAPPKTSRPALEDLSSIFSSLNVNSGSYTLQPQVEVSKNEEPDDDFGDFVGPGDETPGKLAATTQSDNRSVSSFEMANASLSRHGSLPSLDLKIFPQGDDPLDKFKEGCVPVNEWQRCLDCCASLLQSAVNTFTSISSQDVVLEVLGTVEGRAYFTNLKEVWTVCNRIRYSYRRSGLECNQVDIALTTAQQAWDRLERFYKLANIDMVDNEIREEDGDTVSCFICSCPASTEALEYNGHLYHPACVNLWLNCVPVT